MMGEKWNAFPIFPGPSFPHFFKGLTKLPHGALYKHPASSIHMKNGGNGRDP